MFFFVNFKIYHAMIRYCAAAPGSHGIGAGYLGSFNPGSLIPHRKAQTVWVLGPVYTRQNVPTLLLADTTKEGEAIVCGHKAEQTLSQIMQGANGPLEYRARLKILRTRLFRGKLPCGKCLSNRDLPYANENFQRP